VRPTRERLAAGSNRVLPNPLKERDVAIEFLRPAFKRTQLGSNEVEDGRLLLCRHRVGRFEKSAYERELASQGRVTRQQFIDDLAVLLHRGESAEPRDDLDVIVMSISPLERHCRGLMRGALHLGDRWSSFPDNRDPV
jgi:hypothetical protein